MRREEPLTWESVSVRLSASIDFRLSNIRVLSLEKRRGMPGERLPDEMRLPGSLERKPGRVNPLPGLDAGRKAEGERSRVLASRTADAELQRRKAGLFSD